METVKRRLVPVDHALIGQVQSRSLPFIHGARTAVSLLGQLLRISRAEAAGRVKAAEALGHRRTVTGAPVGPQFPLVAAAQAEGAISDRHAKAVVDAVQKLPDGLVDEFGGFVESTLVEQARLLDPARLTAHACDLVDLLDQDGQLRDEDYVEKTRGLDLHRNRDGSYRLDGKLTAECGAQLQAQLDTLTAPRPSEAGPDLRSASQRRHDGLLQILELNERAQVLPPANGVTTAVVLTMDADAWVTGQGTATTGHGHTVSARTAKRWAGHDSRLMLVLLSKTKAIAAYSSSHRISTESQRLALFARDKGCTFPGCTAKIQWCQTHHVQEWSDGGPTSVANLTLACCGDHREHQDMGWRAVMINGLPHWIPPKWVDPDQQASRNTLHD